MPASMQLAGRIISVCYPVMDVALVAVAVRLVGVVHLRRPAYALLAAGLQSSGEGFQHRWFGAVAIKGMAMPIGNLVPQLDLRSTKVARAKTMANAL